MRIVIGIVAVVVYVALVYVLAIRRERNARRDAYAHGLSLVGPTREPVSFQRPAAKGFRRPGGGEAA